MCGKHFCSSPRPAMRRQQSVTHIGRIPGFGNLDSATSRPPAKCARYAAGRRPAATGLIQARAISSIRASLCSRGSHISRLSHPHWSTAVPRLERLICCRTQAPSMNAKSSMFGGEKAGRKSCGGGALGCSSCNCSWTVAGSPLERPVL